MKTTQQDHAPARLRTTAIPAQRRTRPVPLELPAQRTAGNGRGRPVASPFRPGRRRRQPWPVTVGGLAAGFALGTLAVVGGAEGAAEAPAPAVSDEGFVANVSVPGRVLTAFGDGRWQIGVDVAPGAYTTAGAVDPDCRHALRTAANLRDAVEGTGEVGPATVVLGEGDGWFVTAGCATWRLTG